MLPLPLILGAVHAAANIVVVANDAAFDAVRGSNLDYGVPLGRQGNNHPERRRNLLIATLIDNVEGAASAANLDCARAVHSPGFVRFCETAHARWQTELHSDESYLLPGGDPDLPALVPFHCTKSLEPRCRGLAAEFACYMSDFETPLLATTASVLRDDLGVVAACVDRLVRDDSGICYALTTHPGHHAGPSYMSGFCYLNNACIASALLQAAGLRVALLDVDFHGGNGSLDCASKLGLWFRSLHCKGAYPWVDMASQGIELAPGTGWVTGFATALRAALAAMPASTSALVVSLGFDTLATDPEAGKRDGVGLALTPDDFIAMGAVLGSACPRVLIVQEGGYDLSEDGVARAAAALVAGVSTAPDEERCVYSCSL